MSLADDVWKQATYFKAYDGIYWEEFKKIVIPLFDELELARKALEAADELLSVAKDAVSCLSHVSDVPHADPGPIPFVKYLHTRNDLKEAATSYRAARAAMKGER